MAKTSFSLMQIRTAGLWLVCAYLIIVRSECDPFHDPSSEDCKTALKTSCEEDPWSSDCHSHDLNERLSPSDQKLYIKFIARRNQDKDTPGLCCFELESHKAVTDTAYVTNTIPCLANAVAGRPHCNDLNFAERAWNKIRDNAGDFIRGAAGGAVKYVFPPACIEDGVITVKGPGLPCDPTNPLHSCSEWFNTERSGPQCSYVFPSFPKSQFCLLAVPDNYCTFYTYTIGDRKKCKSTGIGYYSDDNGITTAGHVWKGSGTWLCNHTSTVKPKEYVKKTTNPDSINIADPKRDIRTGMTCSIKWPELKGIRSALVKITSVNLDERIGYITSESPMPEKGFSGSPCFASDGHILGVYAGHSYVSGYYIAF